MGLLRIAIDGPGGAGKSTIAKAVAKELNIDYVDTGAMYRAIGLKMIEKKVDQLDEDRIESILENTTIDFRTGSIYLDERKVDEQIRKNEISIVASDFSALAVVREKLVKLQKEMGTTKSLVMDGRDIGTNVLKDAELKIFMTASPEERARRRFLELQDKGVDINFQNVLKDINNRDYQDTHRKLNPLKPADDAIILDTTNMSIQEVIKYIIKEAKGCQK